VVDPVRINDDPALGRLPEDLRQAHDRDRGRRNDVAENLPRADRRQLIEAFELAPLRSNKRLADGALTLIWQTPRLSAVFLRR
jgi:hypothetical protein